MNTDYNALRERAYEANMDLAQRGLVKYNFGNVSERAEGEELFAIKPSGVMYDELRPEDMVVVDFAGNVQDSGLRPSSDAPTHAALYRGFPHIGGVAHSHSPYAVAWAQAGESIPVLGTTHADHAAVDIPCTEIISDRALDCYEAETGNLIVNTFAELSCKEIPMVLVAGHGPFSWGTPAKGAVYNSVMLEEIAKMAYLTRCIKPDASPLKASLIAKHFDRKHGEDAYYGQA